MKICFLGDAAAPHLRRWSRYFTDSGFDVHIITFNHDILPHYEPAKVYLIKKTFAGATIFERLFSAPLTILKTYKLIKQIYPDILHCHDAGGYSWVGMLMLFKPFVVSAWGSDILVHAKTSKVTRFLTALALKKCNLIHCDGYQIQEEIIKLGVEKKKIRVIPFGTDTKKFVPDYKNKEKYKKNYDIKGKIIISTRTLSPIHNVETFVKAIPLVLENLPNARFIITGGGCEFQRLQNLVNFLGVSDFVKFTGYIEESEMVKLLQVADIYVSTSLSESGLAASTAEAMSCALPVINTDTGDIKNWIRDNENGFIVPVNDYQALAEKIIFLIKQDEQLLEKIGVRNRGIIENRNNYYTEMAKMEDIYKGLQK